MPTVKTINLNAHPEIRATLAKRNTRKRLTPKDVFLAKALRRQANSKRHRYDCDSYSDGVVIATYALADAMKRDNPNFDRERFILMFRGKA